MFAVLVGRFHYTGSNTEVRVRDLSVGTYHNSVARDSGDGEESYIAYVSSDENFAKAFATKLEELRGRWEQLFAKSSAWSQVPVEKIRELRDDIVASM